ncbi:MAG: hypothetical protein M1814_003290 [Vezdaea aestivalis]|nr:MAG: hypothetical protein M1814_003290 [Vezdaea aestivalis]
MGAPPVDTSLTGYVSGSVDKQDEIYRNRKRPAPKPIQREDSGYDSAGNLGFKSFSTSSSAPLIGLANTASAAKLLNNDSNFAGKTDFDCYIGDGSSISEYLVHLNSHARAPSLFSTLSFEEQATYRAKSSFSKEVVQTLIDDHDLNALFLPDLLGRPNYWSAELYSNCGAQMTGQSIDFFCQQPRIEIHGPKFVQRSPLSIYMRFDAAKNTTYYIISSSETDECVVDLRNLLNAASDAGTPGSHALLHHPLEIHILLSKILFDVSKNYVNLFRQSMFQQLRAVDGLSLQEGQADRRGLTEVTIELQIISKDVNKLISDVDIALRNLAKTQEAFARIDDILALSCSSSKLASSSSNPSNLRQQLIDTLTYVESSMDKQKMWLYNYRDRKDIAMSLVFNLVTQQDAANNIGIAKGMKRDSSSMHGIALLTMVFLPGTFTATILGAGVFSALAQNREVRVSGLWWFWAAITFPLTGIVLIIYLLFCWRKELQARWAQFTIEKNGGKSNDIEAKG